MTKLTDRVWAVEVPKDLLSPSYHIEQSISSLMNGEGEDDEFVIRYTQRKHGSPLGKITIDLPPGSYRFLFTTKTATEEQAHPVVENVTTANELPVYRDYEFYMWMKSAVGSLRSLLRSKGLDPNKNNYAIIEKQRSDE